MLIGADFGGKSFQVEADQGTVCHEALLSTPLSQPQSIFQAKPYGLTKPSLEILAFVLAYHNDDEASQRPFSRCRLESPLQGIPFSMSPLRAALAAFQAIMMTRLRGSSCQKGMLFLRW